MDINSLLNVLAKTIKLYLFRLPFLLKCTILHLTVTIKEYNMKHKLKWLLFHEPAELFIRTARHFEEEINKLTDNAFEIEILELQDYNDKYNNGKACDPIAEIKSGRVHMSQIYIDVLAQSSVTNFLALGLPFLFKDHDHATRVFEGELGEELLSHLQERLEIKGLSFTYSGGFRVMTSTTPISTIDDFAMLTNKQTNHAISADIFTALGSKAVSADKADLRQTTLPRYHVDARKDQNYVVSTGHSMYLTTILANQDMWNSFDDATKQHFKTASKICAAAERIKSVADGDYIAENKGAQDNLGIKLFSNLDSTQMTKLRNLLAPVTAKWKPYFANDLVDRIATA